MDSTRHQFSTDIESLNHAVETIISIPTQTQRDDDLGELLTNVQGILIDQIHDELLNPAEFCLIFTNIVAKLTSNEKEQYLRTQLFLLAEYYAYELAGSKQFATSVGLIIKQVLNNRNI